MTQPLASMDYLIFAVMSIGTLLVLVNQAYAQDDVVSQLKMELFSEAYQLKVLRSRIVCHLN